MNDLDVPESQFLVYRDEAGALRMTVRLAGESVWLTQQGLAELFQTSVQNINLHVLNIYEEGELQADRSEQVFVIERQEGSRTVRRPVKHYNLDMIISVGYRVKSGIATRFRIWATERLREYVIKGFVLDDDRLKNPDQPFDYFEELTRRIPMHMADWIAKLDQFLALNDREILENAGTVSHEQAIRHAHEQYALFVEKRRRLEDERPREYDAMLEVGDAAIVPSGERSS